MLLYKYLFIFCSTIWLVESSKILGVFPIASYSQWYQGNRLLKELALRGHEVTMISPFEQNPPVQNYRDIVVPEAKFESIGFNALELNQSPVFKRLALVSEISINSTEKILSNAKVQELIKSNEHFDLIIILQFFDDAIRGFQHRFKAPVIGLNPIGASSWVNEVMINPSSPSYIPEIMTKFSSKMSFFERVVNSAVAVYARLHFHLYTLPKHNAILHKYFPDAPDIYDLIYNTSLVLLNSHISISDPVPLLPNLIEVGGYHVTPAKELSSDLKSYLDDAKDGVIYFSLGSFFKSADLPESMRNDILDVFAGLKQKVLWKFENDNIPSLPKNVMVRKWLPQQDILGHPNVKLFITHGGLLSTIETTYHGKPIIGIPLFGDQEMNMASAVRKGYAICIPYPQLTKETLSAAIQEILTNSTYRKNIEFKSKLMKDQPLQPIDKAIYWVEYVIRYNGAPQFRTTATELAWYQYLLLDIVLFFIVLLYSSYFAIKTILRLIFKKKTAVKHKKKQN